MKSAFLRCFILVAVCFTILLSSCGENHSKNEDTQTVDSTKESQPEKANNIFYSIPSPIEMAGLLRKAGAVYNLKYLNDVENIGKYTTSANQAINLGVYGTDMSFASIFDQAQETMLYLKCVNKLSKELGISNAFDDGTASRMEANSGNRDSILQIIADAYWVADSHLKNENRAGISALIIAGGWVEGLYIATKVAETTNNNEIKTRIGEQKLSLNNVLSLLESYPADDNLNLVIEDLKSLRTLFDEIKINQSKHTIKTDAANKISTISGETVVEINDEQLKKITNKIETIRNNLIK
ncbi:MAG: hypothetical protein J0M08_07015 [Bacteroidetes bacterium]|nr:hypothetical protein [Bacteroidota bacterium]